MGKSSYFLRYIDFNNVYNIAIIGNGKNTKDIDFFIKNNKKVTSFDFIEIQYKDILFKQVNGDFNLNCNKYYNSFDIVWACHVLEHQRNVGLFLDNVYKIMKKDALLYLSVPPYKKNIVGGHLSVWNMGLLIYNLCLANFNVKEGRFKKYGYNIFSIVSKNIDIILPDLIYDKGDLETLKYSWNKENPLFQNINGDISEINWFDF